MERLHLFGIRHHGPGSARSLVAALKALQPDLLLIEGPPEAAGLLELVASEHMQPPVALLIYAPEDPSLSAFYPFAEYSPEWQAIRYGLAHQVEIRMMDLPQAIQLAWLHDQRANQEAAGARENEKPGGMETGAASEPGAPEAQLISDPLRALAEAAGYSESEQWWEHLVEQRRQPADVFSAIFEAISALREEAPADPAAGPAGERREASMRTAIRHALAQGFQRVAVVCGAWHAPALADLDGAKQDAALLKGLPKIKVEATWVPWTNSRLTRRSGYGAGIDSPGWYSHLWANQDALVERWMIRAARLLRAEGIDAPPANIIEAVRLAEALAALRDRPLPGLPELNEAALAIFCFGSPLPMRLIEEKLVIGEALGSVPPETPRAPLLRDFERETARLRLHVEAYEKVIDLDLRKPTDLARSHLLHRLNLLDVPWGRTGDSALQSAGSGRGGTFHEVWRVKWQPEFSIFLIDAGQWGNTIAAAASARVSHQAAQAPDLVTLTRLVEDALLADLPEAVEYLMRCLQAQAAVSSDIPHLMDALPPLAGVLRYGNVRQTDREGVAQVVDGLAARIFIGLPAAGTSLNDDAADELFARIEKVNEALGRMADSYQEGWMQALERLAEIENTHGLVSGRACRILLDRDRLALEEAGRRLALNLSPGGDPAQSAAWIDGFLRGSGHLLIHDSSLLGLIDTWLNNLRPDLFHEVLPLLRRTFSSFARPERRGIGERVRQAAAGLPRAGRSADPDFDTERADAALSLLARLLGAA